MCNNYSCDGKLSPRQLEMLQALADGKGSEEIRRRFGITQNTIESHLRDIFNRLGTHNRTAAVAEGFRRGLLK